VIVGETRVSLRDRRRGSAPRTSVGTGLAAPARRRRPCNPWPASRLPSRRPGPRRPWPGRRSLRNATTARSLYAPFVAASPNQPSCWPRSGVDPRHRRPRSIQPRADRLARAAQAPLPPPIAREPGSGSRSSQARSRRPERFARRSSCRWTGPPKFRTFPPARPLIAQVPRLTLSQCLRARRQDAPR